jgi:hypothetical protein
MDLYAVTLRDTVTYFTEFYFADSSEHAEEQALDAHLSNRSLVMCVAHVPRDYVRAELIGFQV